MFFQYQLRASVRYRTPETVIPEHHAKRSCFFYGENRDRQAYQMLPQNM